MGVLTRLGWLHLSDFHFRASGDPLSQTVAIDALIRDVTRHRNSRVEPSFVVVTGDIAFSGRAEEYEAARPYFDRLSAAAQVAPLAFYFVPGNHDVDRTKQHLAFIGAYTDLTSEAQVDRVLGGQEVVPLRDRQTAFWEFVNGFTHGQTRRPTVQGLGYVATVAIDHYQIGLLGLNSAWLSGRNAEEMDLILGERQVIEALGIVFETEPALILALAHHPIEWMQEWDQGVCRERLLAAADIFHRGHLHQAEVSLAGGPAAPCLTVAAGSSHSTRFYGNSYNWVELDLGTGACSIFPHRYDPSLGRYQPAEPLSATIELRALLPGSTEALADAIVSVVPTAEPYAKYLASLLRGEKQDVPIEVDDRVDFLVPSVAREIVGPGVFGRVSAFLELRNLLRLYPIDAPLADRLAEHRDRISNIVEYLGHFDERDPTKSRRMRMVSGQPAVVGTSTRLPHTHAFLEELRAQEDWPILEVQAESLVTSDVAEVAGMARRLYVEALMHSDEAPKRDLAKRLGTDLADRTDATVQDHVLASAASETAGDDSQAVRLTSTALARWPEDKGLREYARGLATRSGNANLRAVIDSQPKAAG
jgi:predicted phosphodiesterase